MAHPKQQVGKTCFVAMPVTTPPFYAEEFNDSKHFPHVLTHLFAPALEEAGMTVIPPSVRGAELIHGEIIKNLEQADLVLCDLSSLNPNVFFELGIRTSLDRPVALVKDAFTSAIPFDINAINTLTYDSSLAPWTLGAEVARLAEHVKDIIDSGNSGNAMWSYFGLTKRGTPSDAGENPIEAKLDLLIREFEGSRPITFSRQFPRGVLDELNEKIEAVVRSILADNNIHQFRVSEHPNAETYVLHLNKNDIPKLSQDVQSTLSDVVKARGVYKKFNIMVDPLEI